MGNIIGRIKGIIRDAGTFLFREINPEAPFSRILFYSVTPDTGYKAGLFLTCWCFLELLEPTAH